MKTIISTVALAFIAVSAFAATNSMTASSTAPILIGKAPVVGYISATVTSTTAPVAAALPTDNDATLQQAVCAVRDSSFNHKSVNWKISGTDIVIATSGQASSTIAVGDQLSCILQYRR